jgi:hypothetical protein
LAFISEGQAFMVTYEETDAAVLKAMAGRANFAAIAPAGAAESPLCSIYQILKPILQGLLATPLFPSNWKTAITDFMAAMEKACFAGNAPAMAAAGALDQEAIKRQVESALIAHLQKFGFNALATPGGPIPPAAAGDPLNNLKSSICPVYKAVKPILDLVKTFVPGPWGVGIGIAEGVLDQLCK